MGSIFIAEQAVRWVVDLMDVDVNSITTSIISVSPFGRKGIPSNAAQYRGSEGGEGEG